MKTVLITGSDGFIGKNLYARLEEHKDINVLRLDKGHSKNELTHAIEKADFIFHLAGVNRPKDDTLFRKVNYGLTNEICSLLNKIAKKTPILISSSVQAELDNAYGKSKKEAENALIYLKENNGNPIYLYRLPNVFGKWSRPNYNSVVATFCNNIANNRDITITDPATKLNLVYIDDVIEDFINALEGNKEPKQDGFCYINTVYCYTLGEIAQHIYSFKESRTNLITPDLADSFNKKLYATYVSFLNEKGYSYPLEMKSDQRGWLVEFNKSESFGQIFISTTKPGVSRGQHWHNTKVEKFLIIKGMADIKFRKKHSKKIITYSVHDTKPEVIEVPTGYIHSVTNTGENDMVMIVWASEIFNQNKPDTYYEEV